MGLFEGKKGLIFGIANDHSIAWAITEKLHAEGAEMGFSHLPDKDPERPRMERRVRKLVEPLGAKLILPCDVTRDEDLDRILPRPRNNSARSTSCCTRWLTPLSKTCKVRRTTSAATASSWRWKSASTAC